MTKKNFIGIGTRFYLSLCIILFLLAGCGYDTGITDESDGRVALQASSNIEVRQQGTRATDNQWTQNDSIGIYMMRAGESTILEGADNRHYKAAGSGENTEFMPAGEHIYFPVNGEQVDFSAYYPYMPLQDDTYTIDLSDQDNQEAIDLMTAIEENHSKATPEVSFQFIHRLSKIVLSVAAGTGIADADLENLKVEISGQYTGGTYEPVSGDFDISQENPEIIVLKTATDGTEAEAILMPNDVENNDPMEGRQLIFTLEDTEEVFFWNIPDDKYFNQGEKNIYHIIINRTGLEVTSSITDWAPGNGEEGEDGIAE